MSKAKVDILISTTDDQFSPQTGFNLIKILNDLGIETNYPLQQTSCGKELYDLGDFGTAKDLGEKLMKQFSGSNPIVCSSSSWVAYIKTAFPKLFFNTAYHIENQEFLARVHDITDYLVNIAGVKSTGNVFPHKVAFMDNCQTLNNYGLHNEPRLLLQNTEGLELLEFPDFAKHTCCGMGSVAFSSDFEAVSTKLARHKIETALNMGAEVITSTDTACLLHLQSHINKSKINLRCMHIIDILASKNAL